MSEKVDAPSTDYFLKLDGIAGESKDAKHKDEIDIISWFFRAHQTRLYDEDPNPSNASAEEIVVTKRADKASALLFVYSSSHKPIPSLLITCRKAGKDQQEFLVIACADVFATSFRLGHSDADGEPVESVTFSFRKIEMSYREQQDSGSLGGAMKASWDLKQAPSN